MNTHCAQIAKYIATVVLCAALAACGGGDGGGSTSASASVAGSTASSDTTTGVEFEPPNEVDAPDFDPSGAVSQNDGSIDTSSVNDGVVLAQAKSKSRLKFVVACGDMSYNYDLPGDGTPIACPINMGDGAYEFAIMRNVGGNDYVQTTSASAKVKLSSEFAPFLQPNLFCDYADDSACVQKSKELTADAQNVGDAVRAVCTYITDNVVYDTDKAESLGKVTGYVPNPDETFATNKGICFDYASLGAAMLRSIGIPTKIVTGYVSPNDLYHAWIMIYIDGSWTSAKFEVDPLSWSRIDLTFGTDSGSEELVGNGKTYTDRYVY
ncbi:MAG: transglutaminase-like domain-containing protein [Coriobacteriales bacterium]|nr:transglutaminase-like domain-containing protein [Coriobacteriales bacterium]